jgi:hypothetical protein
MFSGGEQPEVIVFFEDPSRLRLSGPKQFRPSPAPPEPSAEQS